MRVAKNAPAKKATTGGVGTYPAITIKDEPEQAFKASSARANWWSRLQEFNGKSIHYLKESVEQEPPHITKSGGVEPISGWLSFFKREGLLEVVA